MKNIFAGLLVTSALYVSSAFGLPLNVDDVTYEGESADAVYGPLGDNDDVDIINGLGIPGTPFVLLDKTDSGSTPFLGVTFTLTADVDETSGIWTLTWGPADSASLPLKMDFVFVVKGGPDAAAYLFSDIIFTSSPTTGEGTFSVELEVGQNGNNPELSHASIYGRGGTTTDEEFPVPEPGTLVLFGTALLGLGFAKKRKAKA